MRRSARPLLCLSRRLPRGRSPLHLRAALSTVVVLAAVSCGGPNPVSTGVPRNGAQAPTAQAAESDIESDSASSTADATSTTSRPATTTAAPDETDAPSDEPDAPDEPAAPEEGDAPPGVPSTNPVLVGPGVTIVGESVEQSTDPFELAALVGFVDDEPSFDGEPLQPFLDAAELPTGWAAFDFFLADALLRNGNTAASVAVSIGGDVVHRAAMGERAPRETGAETEAETEAQTGDATGGETRDDDDDESDGAEPIDRFRIASISKVLTAITLLQLVEDGVVGLDEQVGRLVAEHVGVSDPSRSIESITVRQLLNHTAGFGKYRTVFFGGGADDCTEAARSGLGRSPTSTPGGTYRYSNMNYCVAGELIEALTGQDYDDVVYARVLTPLGISGPRLAATFDPGPDEILHPTTPGRNYMETLGGAGGWIATPEDLVTVLDSLDPATPGHKLLDPATLELMKTPVGGQRGQRGYGLGLLLYGGERYGHTGTIEATHAMAMNRGDGVTWAITVSGPYPDDTPHLESIINHAFEAAGFTTA